MNRRNFFKNLGAATVGVIVGPAVIAKAAEETPAFNAKKLDKKIAALQKGIHQAIVTVGDSAGGETPGAPITIRVLGNRFAYPKVGYCIYHLHKRQLYALRIVAVIPYLTSSYYNMILKLYPYSSDLVIGKGSIKDGTKLIMGGSGFVSNPKTTDPPVGFYEAKA